jgi:hypothetical protein
MLLKRSFLTQDSRVCVRRREGVGGGVRVNVATQGGVKTTHRVKSLIPFSLCFEQGVNRNQIRGLRQAIGVSELLQNVSSALTV